MLAIVVAGGFVRVAVGLRLGLVFRDRDNAREVGTTEAVGCGLWTEVIAAGVGMMEAV